MKFSLVALALAASVLAAPLTPRAPLIPAAELAENRAKGLHLIETEETEGSTPIWKTDEEVLDLIKADIGFFDVTETYEDNEKIKTTVESKDDDEKAPWPPVAQQPTVRAVIARLSIPQMKTWLSSLTAYKTRYYTTATGVSASNKLYSTLRGIVASRSDVSVSQFTHSWAQKSVILKFAGSSPASPITILGCHIDTINAAAPSTGTAPGADDNGSGCVNLMDTVRSLVAVGYRPKTPLEFHFYAAEEVGLLGSQAIANNYIGAGKKVKAYVNLDMTAYFKPGSPEVVALVDDRVSASLNTYLRSLISTYLRIPAGSDHCGYACSDHGSWTARGVPAAFPFEAPTVYENPNMHTPGDTTSVVGWSWSHSLEFAKLAVAVAVELTAV